MQVICHKCGATVPAENLNLDRMVAKCSSCHAVFAFDVGESKQEGRRRENIARPDRLQIEEFGGETVVTRRWFHIVLFLFLIVFTVFWNGLTWTMSLGGFFDDLGWFIRLFFLPFQVIGLGVAYFTVCVLVNRTTITVGNGRLVVHSGPLPFPGNVDLAAADIDQLFVTEKVSVHRNSNNMSTSTSVSYPLEARMKNGTRKTILRAPKDADESLFLEQLIEDKLGIVDRPVRGEI